MRRLVALVAHLPPDSAYARTSGSWWDDRYELQAVTVEMLHALLRLTARAYGAKRVPKQLVIPRPGATSRTPIERGARKRMKLDSFLATLVASTPAG